MTKPEWARPTNEQPPRAGLFWNGECWIDPPTGRVWRQGPEHAVLRTHLAELVALPQPSEFDRDVARLLAVVTS